MDFVTVVDQAIVLLRQRGRVTYRTLKRQFQLDDTALEDLTVELIKGQRLAADEDGEVLVWIGDPPSSPASAAVVGACTLPGHKHPLVLPDICSVFSHGVCALRTQRLGAAAAGTDAGAHGLREPRRP